jgi:hypothetical protein
VWHQHEEVTPCRVATWLQAYQGGSGTTLFDRVQPPQAEAPDAPANYLESNMSHKKTVLTLALGSAIAATLGSASASANASPFSAQPLAKGYMLAAADAADARPAAKAAEGKCGDMKKDDKAAEAKCGDMKKGDKAAGKSGDAKCGGMKKMEGKCGGMKKKMGGMKKMDGKGDVKSDADAKKADPAKAKDASCGASMKSGDGKAKDASCGASMKSEDKK